MERRISNLPCASPKSPEPRNGLELNNFKLHRTNYTFARRRVSDIFTAVSIPILKKTVPPDPLDSLTKSPKNSDFAPIPPRWHSLGRFEPTSKGSLKPKITINNTFPRQKEFETQSETSYEIDTASFEFGITVFVILDSFRSMALKCTQSTRLTEIIEMIESSSSELYGKSVHVLHVYWRDGNKGRVEILSQQDLKDILRDEIILHITIK